MNKLTIAAGAVALATAGLGIAQTSTADAGGGRLNFGLQRSPGIVAHPCLPTYSPRCHELSSFSATSFRG